MLIALCIDRLIGWPDAVYRWFSHPVVAMGYLISLCESGLNRPSWPPRLRCVTGLLCVCLVVSIMAAISSALVFIFPSGVAETLLTSVCAWPFLAAKSLEDHVRAVAISLQVKDLPGARNAVSKIVGRYAGDFDESAIAGAALESLAENTSDAVIAPLFWGALFGLPGLVVYKAINTGDSMIGHKNDRYGEFGWATARLDDLVNLIPARFTGLIYIGLARAPFKAARIMLKEAGRHSSPNAGWPEAALAAALGVRLSGPRIYDGILRSDPWLNEIGRDPDTEDLNTGLHIFNRLLLVISLCLVGFSALLFLMCH